MGVMNSKRTNTQKRIYNIRKRNVTEILHHLFRKLFFLVQNCSSYAGKKRKEKRSYWKEDTQKTRRSYVQTVRSRGYRDSRSNSVIWRVLLCVCSHTHKKVSIGFLNFMPIKFIYFPDKFWVYFTCKAIKYRVTRISENFVLCVQWSLC